MAKKRSTASAKSTETKSKATKKAGVKSVTPKAQSTKPSSSTSNGAFAASKKASSSSKAGSKKTAKKIAAQKKSSALFNSEEIGFTAGAVWGILSQSGELTLAALKKEIDSPGDLVTAAVGWLAREEKLSFLSTGRSVKITLS